MSNVMYFTCIPSEENFAKLFNLFNEFKGSAFAEDIDHVIEYANIEIDDDICQSDEALIAQLKKQGKKTSFSKGSFKESRVVVDIIVPYDDSDIDAFFYRYLIILKNQLLKHNDIVIISCSTEYFYKISSFFYFENYENDYSARLYAYTLNSNLNLLELKKFTLGFIPSSEWLPAMSFCKNERNRLFDVLSLPICESKSSFDDLYTLFKKEYCDTKKLIKSIPAKAHPDNYKAFFLCCIFYWINDIDPSIADFISERSYTVSTLSILLLAIQLKYMSKMKKSKMHSFAQNMKAKEHLLNICLDFAEGILQIVENMTNHSNGGCFLLRINDNLNKIEEDITYDENLNPTGYIRISVIDYSKKGIVEKIQEKYRLSTPLSLNDVFRFNKIKNQEYHNYMMDEDSTVHHYGLPVFNSVVLQYLGCFSVKSKGTKLLNPQFDVCVNYDKKGFKLNDINQIKQNHIPGTEYIITLPLRESYYINSIVEEGITSVFSDCEYDAKSIEMQPVFQPSIYGFFSDDLNGIITALEKQYDNLQELKEKTINNASIELSKRIRENTIENPVFYFYVNTKKIPFRRTEIIAKILLKTFLLLNKENINTNVVLYGFSDLQIKTFIRQFALFYRNGICKYMQSNQMYVISDSYNSEILLYGAKLVTSYEHLCSQIFKYGTSSYIAETLNHILSITKQDSTTIDSLRPIDFDIMKRIEIAQDKPVLSPTNKKWFYYKLDTVINNDIHDKYLGCKIADTHVRVNNIHIDTFYECQLLFGNPFWCRIFSSYIVENILKDEKIDIKKPIILYGYETYSEQLLLLMKRMLSSVLQTNSIEYIIFENSKFITSNEKSENGIRYLDRAINHLGKKMQYANYIFINGISTTLSTFKEQLFKQLEKEMNDRSCQDWLTQVYISAYVIVQVFDEEKGICEKYIEKVNDNYVRSKERYDYLDFAAEGKCKYLISTNAKWYEPDHCDLCMPPKSPMEEKFLVETNNTSTVPMSLIKPRFLNDVCSSVFKPSPKCTFFKKIENQAYLYYCHLNRSENHYQYYIRTAHFIQDSLKSNTELKKWFDYIKNEEGLNNKEGTTNKINIIISPLHFSNEAFVASINQYVFNNQAHVISIDSKKEFRDSFETKFYNYKTMIELISKEMSAIEFTINFYFVDDQLITGSHFQRAKSLINGLINELSNSRSNNLKINIFQAAIILVNRNSTKTISNFGVNSYYSFIDLRTPSIRSYGDSCPLCQEVLRIQHIVEESSLSSTEHYWRSKLNDHTINTMQQAKEKKTNYYQNVANSDKIYKQFDVYRGFRRLQCSEEIWKTLGHIYEEINTRKKSLKKCIYDYLSKYLCDRKIKSDFRIIFGENASNLTETKREMLFYDYRIEYLISFLKVASRPHIIYQEHVNSAILQIILELYEIFFEQDKETSDDSLYDYVYDLIKACSPQIRYDLYRVIISCLCSLSSNYFYRDEGEALIKCFEKGNELEISEDDEVPFADYLRFQIKRNMFSNKDSALKIRSMSKMLLSKIKEEV